MTSDSTYTNPVTMTVAGAVFIVQFVITIVTLPIVAVDALVAVITLSSPTFGAALTSGALLSVMSMLKIAFLAWVYLKAYEVLANRYNLV